MNSILHQKNRLLPFNPKIMSFVKSLRKKMTKEEKKLWYDFLRNSEYKFVKQKPIDNFIVDFYCARAKLAIEVDGSHHFLEDNLQYDKIRSEILEIYNIKVIRFSNSEVNEKFKDVCESITNIVSERTLKKPPQNGEVSAKADGGE